MVRQEAPLVKHVCLETVNRPAIQYQERSREPAVRGVCAEYGEIRNEVPGEGRWISREDLFANAGGSPCSAARLKKKLFSGRQAVGETISIAGVRFTVIGTMDNKLQLSNYFSSDDESIFIPYTAAGDLWNTRYASVMVFMPYHAGYSRTRR